MPKFYLFLVPLLFAFSAFAQDDAAADFGTKTLYQPAQIRYTEIPKGYRPVYINLISRHGARHLTKGLKLYDAYNILKKADSLQLLSDAGSVLWKMVVNLDQVEEKGVASISAIGADELEGIAKRMYGNYKTVFAAPVTPLLVATTKKGRTKQSAEAFLNGLKAERASLVANVKFNYADDDHLRFYDFSTAYEQFKENGNWMAEYEKLAQANNLPAIAERFSAQFFKPAYWQSLSTVAKTSLTEDIYGFYVILPAIQKEIDSAKLTRADLAFKQFFTAAELSSLAQLSNAEDFLKKGPGMDANGIQVKIAAPLLADFINTADSYLQSGLTKANLRFAHAETIAPFAAIMAIKGASEPATDILQFNKIWQANQIIPLSANIQWIFYKNEANGKYLLKFLLNEKEVAITGLPVKDFPYYQWTAVRSFYVSKLKQLGVGLSDDMHSYLLNLHN